MQWKKMPAHTKKRKDTNKGMNIKKKIYIYI